MKTLISLTKHVMMIITSSHEADDASQEFHQDHHQDYHHSQHYSPKKTTGRAANSIPSSTFLYRLLFDCLKPHGKKQTLMKFTLEKETSNGHRRRIDAFDLD
jgi:hypothetical protein